MLSPSLGLGGYCRQHMQSEVERARTTSRLIMGKLLHNRNGRYPLSPLRKYIIPWFCLQSHIHWLLVAKWDRRIQLLILAWWPGRHTTPTPCWWPGCCRHRSRSCCEFYKYFHTEQTLTTSWPTARHLHERRRKGKPYANCPKFCPTGPTAWIPIELSQTVFKKTRN